MVTREKLFNALGFVESSNNQKAVSPKGAIGTYQTMPATLGDPGFGVKPARNNSLEEADRVGKDYLMAMLKRHDGNLEHALVSYNYGPGKADKWIASGAKKKDLPKETRDYLTKMKKALGGASMARRPLEFVKQDKLSELTKKAAKNPDSADARKVVRELIARGLPVPKKLQKTIGKARAEAGVGSPPRKVPRPERKPRVPKEPTQEELENEARRTRNMMRAASLLNPVSSTAMVIAEGIDALRGRGDTPAQRQRPVRMRAASDFERTPQRGGRFMGSPPLQRRAEDIALPFNRPPPERQLRRGVSRVPTGDFGVGSGLTDRAEDIRIGPSGPGMGYDPNLDPTTGISIDDDVIQERFMRDSPRGSDAPLTDNEGRDYETLREYFIENLAPRKSNVMTPLGIVEIDTTQEGMFPEEDMYTEKKGGRLKKKKRVARKKKAAPKKKKTVAKKKPVVRKKAVAKKPPVRKKAVAKKPAGRKRAAKRGFGAELRGN